MKIRLEGLVSDEIKQNALDGKIAPYLICATDLYFAPDSLSEGDVIDMNRRCPVVDSNPMMPFHTQPGTYFSKRVFRVIDLRDGEAPENDAHYDTIQELYDRLDQFGPRSVSTLPGESTEVNDKESTYIMNPLTDEETALLYQIGSANQKKQK